MSRENINWMMTLVHQSVLHSVILTFQTIRSHFEWCFLIQQQFKMVPDMIIFLRQQVLPIRHHQSRLSLYQTVQTILTICGSIINREHILRIQIWDLELLEHLLKKYPVNDLIFIARNIFFNH